MLFKLIICSYLKLFCSFSVLHQRIFRKQKLQAATHKKESHCHFHSLISILSQNKLFKCSAENNKQLFKKPRGREKLYYKVSTFKFSDFKVWLKMTFFRKKTLWGEFLVSRFFEIRPVRCHTRRHKTEMSQIVSQILSQKVSKILNST